MGISSTKAKSCHGHIKHCNVHTITNLSFVACQFSDNVVSVLMNFDAQYCTANLFIIGPSQLTRTKSGLYRYKQNDVIFVYKMTVTL